ncbi:MAG: serine/threonine-protein kinase [Kofleriaceae bacterium]
MGLVWRILVVLAGGALAAVMWTRTAGIPAQPPTAADVQTSAQRLGGALREQASALHARVTTLAQLPRLAAAVTTDAATCADLTRDELAFTPLADETIELVQRAGERTSRLLRIGAEHELAINFAGRGTSVLIDRQGLILTEVQPVGEAGAIAVSWRARISEDGAVAGSLVVGTSTLAIAGGAPENSRLATVPLAMPGVTYLAALGSAGTPPAWPLRGAGLAFALVAVIVAACWPRRRREAVVPVAPRNRFGRYEAISIVDERELSTVYVARKTGEAGFERRVTLDVVHPPLARDPRVVEALLGESRVASRITHPNLIEILDLGYTGGECFIATEYVEGGDLAKLLAHLRTTGRRMPVGMALAIARRICDGLAALHTAADPDGRPLGIVHRDVRSANVYLARSGNVKLGGFGHATALRTSGLAMRGSPQADLRVDVGGAGEILYELLTGSVPDPDVPMLALRVDLPIDLDGVVRRAIAHDLDRRYPSCAAFEADLERIAVAYDLEPTDREIAQWLASDVSWSPTLRGWPAISVQPVN